MSWIASVAMLCPSHHRAAAASTAAALSDNPADDTPLFFGRPVGAAGALLPSHYLAHSRIRAVALAALPQLEHQYPGAVWTITAHDDDSPEQAAARPTVDGWLESLGLVFLDTPEED